MLERRARFHKTQEVSCKTTIQPTHTQEWDSKIEEEDSHLNISTDDNYINFELSNTSSDEDSETTASYTPPNATDTPSSKHSEQDAAEWRTPDPDWVSVTVNVTDVNVTDVHITDDTVTNLRQNVCFKK